MIKCLENEISHLSLTPLYWQQQPLAVEQVPSHILLWYYKWPDRVARLRTAYQMSNILESDQSFKSVFLQHLKESSFEVDTADYLSILLLLNNTIYSQSEIETAISCPSILSNKVLNQLGYDAKIIDENFYTSKSKVDEYSHLEDFKRAQNGLAPLYLSFLEHVSEDIKYSLLSHCEYEWRCIKERQDFIYFDYYGFSRDQFFPSDKLLFNLSTKAETIMLSAYLRTLAFANQCLGLSLLIANDLAEMIKPFGSSYSKLQPFTPPEGWPKLNEIEENTPLPDESDLSDYLKSLVSSKEKTLFASGPIIRVANGVCIDLEVKLLEANDQLTLIAEDIFNDIEQESYNTGNIRPLSTRIHPLELNLGRLEINIAQRGVEAPKYAIGTPPAFTKTTESATNYYFGNQLNAQFKFWQHHWYPAFYAGLGPAMGSYLVVPEDIWNILRGSFDNSIYMLGRLTIIDKRNYNQDHNPIEVYSMVKI